MISGPMPAGSPMVTAISGFESSWSLYGIVAIGLL